MKKSWQALLMVATLVMAIGGIAACKKEELPPAEEVYTEGPETGIYYSDANGREDLLSLNSGHLFTLVMKSVNKSGTYTAEGDKVTFTFAKAADGI